MVSEQLRKDLEEALKTVPKDHVVALERTENSDLINIAKPSEAEFFERLFAANGTFFSLYRDLGIGAIPNEQYMHLIGGRMYFCTNVFDKYVYSIGMRKDLDVANGRLTRKRRITPDNIMLLLSAPIDNFKHASSTIVTAFKINEALREFTDFSIKAKKERMADFTTDSLAERALEKAILCMKYSFLSSISFSLKIKLAQSEAFTYCETERFSALLKSRRLDETQKEFGFYSLNPYAISEPRFFENPEPLQKLSVPAPINPYLRWRENCKFLAARYLAVRRRAYLAIGKKTGLGDLVFYLRTSELASAEKLRDVAEARRTELMSVAQLEMPPRFIFVDGKLITPLPEPGQKNEKTGVMEGLDKVKSDLKAGEPKSKPSKPESLRGKAVGGLGTMSGRAVFVNSRDDFSKNLDGAVLVSKTLIPDLVEVYDKIVAVVSESGGAMAHAAVVAREMNLPCVVQADITGISEGAVLTVDGKTGEIRVV